MSKTNNELKRMTGWQMTSYGLGTFGQNFGLLLVNFGMLFMTDYVGMNAGITATLIAVSKIFDAVTDIIAGTIIDRTRHKMGRARIWLLRMAPLMLLVSIAFFLIPTQASDVVKYIYFFITYTIFSDVLYTLFTVSHVSMTLFATDQPEERTRMSILNFVGTVASSILITSVYLRVVAYFGGGIRGWRILALIFGALFLALQLIYIFSIREMPHEEKPEEQRENFLDNLKHNLGYLAKNRYFLCQLGVMLIYTLSAAAFGQVIQYYCIRVLGDVNNAAGTQTFLSLATSGTIIGVLFAGVLLKKLGLYRTNLYTRILCCICYIPVIIGGLRSDFTLIIVGELLFYLCQGPYLGTTGVLLGEICTYSKLKNHVDLEATVSSANSFGTKVGNALGTACVGWLLAAAHYDGTLAVQPDSSLNMIRFIFIAVPIICQILIAILLSMMDVQKANEKLKAENDME